MSSSRVQCSAGQFDCSSRRGAPDRISHGKSQTVRYDQKPPSPQARKPRTLNDDLPEGLAAYRAQGLATLKAIEMHAGASQGGRSNEGIQIVFKA